MKHGGDSSRQAKQLAWSIKRTAPGKCELATKLAGCGRSDAPDLLFNEAAKQILSAARKDADFRPKYYNPQGMERETSRQEVLRALAAGHDRWPQFWQEFGKVILAEIKKYGVTNQQQREDLYQDLATKLISHDYLVIRSYLENDMGLPFSALLRTVIKSIVIDDWRRRRRWSRVLLDGSVEWAGNNGCLEGTDDPAGVLHRKTRLICLLGSLSDRLKDPSAFHIMYLRYLQENSVNSIAEHVGISPNAVSQRLRVYRRRLLSEFGPELAELIND